MGGKSDGPSGPDPKETIPLQSYYNKDDYRFMTRANNPNIVTDDYVTRYVGDPGSPDFRQESHLVGTARDIKGATDQASLNRANVAKDISGQLGDRLGSPVDYSQFREHGEIGDPNQFRQEAQDAALGFSTDRLDERFGQQKQALDVKLRSQGLQPGDEAYDDAMKNQAFSENDAYAQARAAAYGEGRAESELGFGQQIDRARFDSATRGQQVQEELQRRGWSINEINALLSGTAIGDPSTSFQGSNNMGSTDVLGAYGQQYDADLNRYNARQQQRQGLFSGIGTIVGGMFGGPAGAAAGGAAGSYIGG